MEEGPKKSEKEHYLRGNEKDKTQAKTPLDRTGVATLKGSLANHISPPETHAVEQSHQRIDQERRAIGVHKEGGPNG